MEKSGLKIRSVRDCDVKGKVVLYRPDINSPIDPESKRIVNFNRIEKTVPTLSWMCEQGARVAIIAHQGDSLDYQNLVCLEEHASKLAELSGKKVGYIDDVCGPAARAGIAALRNGEALVLGNLRYLAEEISTFEDSVKLEPREMLGTWLVRSLSPLVDLYVNDAFAAAHRNAPSMVAFEEIVPTAAGFQLMDEYAALKAVMDNPRRPCVYVLGGAKISDAFSMMRKVLEDGSADTIVVAGVTGNLMYLAAGGELGRATREFLAKKGLDGFIPEAKALLEKWADQYVLPVDLAYEDAKTRKEIDLPPIGTKADMATWPGDALFLDIGQKTIDRSVAHVTAAGSVFVNGPAGMYEKPMWEKGTRTLWNAIADSKAYTVVGGGDTINAAAKFCDLSRFGYVCTGGGAMVRFLAGKSLPLITAMEKACALNH